MVKLEKTIFNVVSFSGGKDSTAMLLRIIEENIPIDCILFCDTGLESPQMYEHLDKVERQTGLSITRVKAERTFEYMMFDRPVKRHTDSPVAIKYGADRVGYGWPGPKNEVVHQRIERFTAGAVPESIQAVL